MRPNRPLVDKVRPVLHAARWSAPRATGFTLLELLIAMTIAGLMSAMALPNFSSLVARHRLHAVAYDLQADIALARQEAGRRAVPVHLMFQPGAQWCYALSTGVGIDCRQASVAPGNGVIKVVRAADQPGVLLLEATTMALDGRNGASLSGAGHARFGTTEGRQLQVRLGTLGRASLCAPADRVAGMPDCPGRASVH